MRLRQFTRFDRDIAASRLDALPGADEPIADRPRHPQEAPPAPPIALTPLVACDPGTPTEVLWHIARNVPELRRWLVANPSADAELLEYISQAGGPGVREALELLLDSLEPSPDPSAPEIQPLSSSTLA